MLSVIEILQQYRKQLITESNSAQGCLRKLSGDYRIRSKIEFQESKRQLTLQSIDHALAGMQDEEVATSRRNDAKASEEVDTSR